MFLPRKDKILYAIIWQCSKDICGPANYMLILTPQRKQRSILWATRLLKIFRKPVGIFRRETTGKTGVCVRQEGFWWCPIKSNYNLCCAGATRLSGDTGYMHNTQKFEWNKITQQILIHYCGYELPHRAQLRGYSCPIILFAQEPSTYAIIEGNQSILSYGPRGSKAIRIFRSPKGICPGGGFEF